METKSSEEIVDELLKELQGQSYNVEDRADVEKNIPSDHSERENKSGKHRSKKHKKRERNKDDLSDKEQSVKHKHKNDKKKQKHKKKKKKNSDNYTKNYKSGKRHHKHKHKGRSENNDSSDSHSDKVDSQSEDSVEIEWESDHDNYQKSKPSEIKQDSCVQNKTKITVENVLNTDFKSVGINSDKKGETNQLKEATNEKQIDTSTENHGPSEIEGICMIESLNIQSNDDQMTVETSINNTTLCEIPDKADLASTEITKVDNTLIKVLEMPITDSLQNDIKIKSVVENNISVNITKGISSECVISQIDENDKEKEKIQTSDIKSTTVFHPSILNNDLCQKRILELKEDGELSGTSNSIENISKESSACSAEDTDGEIDSELKKKKRKSKSSKKHKRHGKKRKYSSHDLEEKGRKYRSRSKSRSKSRSPHKSKRRRRSPSHSAESCSSTVVNDHSPLSDRKAKSQSHHSHSPVSLKHKTHSRSKSHDKERRRSRSPRRVHHSDLREKIDKAKLLEIARKNAMVMISQGKLPAGVNIDNFKKEQLVTSKNSGKSVEELTDFCKQLMKKEGDTSSSDNEKKDIVSEDEIEGPFIQHPFKLREAQPNIVLNIRNAVQIPVKTPAEKAAETAKLRIQFPVSSGSQHRKKESEWIPVSHQTNVAPVVLAQPQNDKVFQEKPVKPEIIDIGSIISQRLKAVRKLQENPQDIEALTQMYSAQQQMQSWAESKQLPGQFTGVTDARLLTPAELAGPAHTQAWVKKDLFNKAAPIDGGMGMYLLRKMGWNPGEGLGKNKEGTIEPLVLDIKTDKKGLTSSDELAKKIGASVPVLKDLSGKHPVSALVELCSKRKWGPPEFTLIHDSGPDHKKNFLFKVRINNVDYQPAIASPNKKHAKAQAATVCLQHLGLLPRSYNNLV